MRERAALLLSPPSFLTSLPLSLSLPSFQVLDDSTDKTTRDLVDDKVAEWRERGVNVYALRRTNRSGYKAGALKAGTDIKTAYTLQFAPK